MTRKEPIYQLINFQRRLKKKNTKNSPVKIFRLSIRPKMSPANASFSALEAIQPRVTSNNRKSENWPRSIVIQVGKYTNNKSSRKIHLFLFSTGKYVLLIKLAAIIPQEIESIDQILKAKLYLSFPRGSKNRVWNGGFKLGNTDHEFLSFERLGL